MGKCCLGWGKVLQDAKAGSHLWHCCGCSYVTSVPQQEDFVLQVQERHGLMCLSTSSESCFHQVTYRMIQRSWQILEEEDTVLKLGFGYVELL